jgi:hypothetical protein
VQRTIGNDVRRLNLTVESHGKWRRSGQELPVLRDCTDVDLEVTPATNTLPIRRLALPIGKGQDVTAAWVRFPDLEIEVLPQRYIRLNQNRYHYETTTGFAAEIQVDEMGLVTAYPGGWERLASR